jgi:hypothetical protein
MGDNSKVSLKSEQSEKLSRPQSDGSRYSNPDSFVEWVTPNYWKFIKYKWTSRNDDGGGCPANQTEVGRLRRFLGTV